MDDLVERALAKWPNVPSIAGWLALSEQGNWLLTSPGKAFADNDFLRVSNQRIQKFIATNYAAEKDGRYFFQNGPQKAYVTLEYTPWIFRIVPAEQGWVLVSHTGLVVMPSEVYSDENGKILLNTNVGIGLLFSGDTSLFSDSLIESAQVEFEHSANWWVPTDLSKSLPAQVLALRSSGVKPEVRKLSVPIQFIKSSELPAQFGFNPNPEICP